MSVNTEKALAKIEVIANLLGKLNNDLYEQINAIYAEDEELAQLFFSNGYMGSGTHGRGLVGAVIALHESLEAAKNARTPKTLGELEKAGQIVKAAN